MSQLNNEKKYNWLEALPECTELKQYINGLQKNVLFDENYTTYENRIKESIESQEHPFLSVLIRTQGKREEGLRESLLCVQAQTFTDYEVILIGHKADVEGKRMIQDILDDQQDDFREKIRYIELDEGTRTVPLNMGFACARGEYISVFDDDDILFDNWAEGFYKAAQKNTGRILHGYAFSQDWENVKELGYRAIGRPKALYCQNFDLLWQLVNNRCPLMTLAFPVAMFQKMGICFDEKLNIMEDWEYFMRLALICGVTDIPEPVAIYRFWKNIETSATLHNQEEWTQMYEEIRDDSGRNGFLFSKDYSEDIIRWLTNRYEINVKEDIREKARLYYSKGDAFNDDMIARVASDGRSPYFNYWFPLKMRTKQIKALRFDLSEDGLYMLEELYIGVHYKDGTIVEIPLEECAHTGLHFFGRLLFLQEHPSIVWEMEKEGFIECVHISGKLLRNFRNTSKKYRLFELLFSYKYLKKNRELHKKGWF